MTKKPWRTSWALSEAEMGIYGRSEAKGSGHKLWALPDERWTHQMPSDIPDALEAYGISRANTKIDKRITTQMVDSCAAEIRERARVGDTFCTFVVPLFKFGLPLYDAGRIADYVGWTLERRGFKVIRVSSNALFVSWFKGGTGRIEVPSASRQKSTLENALALARSLGKHEKGKQGGGKKRH